MPKQNQVIEFCGNKITVCLTGYVYVGTYMLLGEIRSHTKDTYKIVGIEDLNFPFISIKSAAIALFLYRKFKMYEDF